MVEWHLITRTFPCKTKIRSPLRPCSGCRPVTAGRGGHRKRITALPADLRDREGGDRLRETTPALPRDMNAVKLLVQIPLERILGELLTAAHKRCRCRSVKRGESLTGGSKASVILGGGLRPFDGGGLGVENVLKGL